MVDLGLFLARAVFGLFMAAHGSQKLFGWFGGYGIAGTGGYFESLGFRPGRVFAAAAGLAEFSGGLLLALGFLQPVAAALILSVMIVATVTVHLGQGLFAGTNGIEVPVLYGTGAAAMGLIGPGIYSLDWALGLSGVWSPALTVAVLAAGVIAGFANLGLRRTEPRLASA
jgi:putative oxidoreductase